MGPLLVFPPMNLNGRTALVTGGARRVGRALTEALGRAGASVVANYNSSAAEADELVAQLSAEGIVASAFRADVSRSDDIHALMRHVREQHGQLDILVTVRRCSKARRSPTSPKLPGAAYSMSTSRALFCSLRLRSHCCGRAATQSSSTSSISLHCRRGPLMRITVYQRLDCCS